MLKFVYINKKKIPVPVPLRTLSTALEWIQQTLVPQGHTITRVVMNDKVLGEDVEHDEKKLESMIVAEATRLEIQIDSPLDLAVQTLDAIRNLGSVILSGLKPLAVECWQAKPVDKPGDLDGVSQDVTLINDLIDHVTGLVDFSTVETAPLQGIAGMLQRAASGVELACSSSDWRACARLLLNRLEPLLKELIAEAETLQIQLVTHEVSSTPHLPGKVRAPTG